MMQTVQKQPYSPAAGAAYPRGRLGDTRAVEALRPLLKDDDEKTADAARRALVELGALPPTD